jgi:hypothetical protein
MACGHGASVDLRSGGFVDGVILGSDRHRLYVERDHGRPLAIDGDDIDYIDYPGNVLQSAGGLTVLLGAAIAGDMPDRSTWGAARDSAVVWLPGLAMLAWGTYLNLHARSLARHVTREQERISNERPYLPAPPARPAPPRGPGPPAPAPVLPPPAVQPTPPAADAGAEPDAP